MTNPQSLETLFSGLDPFMTNADECYVTMKTNGITDLYRVDTDAFRQVVQSTLSTHGTVKLTNDDWKAAINGLQGKARINKRTGDVCVRVAERDDRIYIDLATPSRQIVEVSAVRWNVIQPPLPLSTSTAPRACRRYRYRAARAISFPCVP